MELIEASCVTERLDVMAVFVGHSPRPGILRGQIDHVKKERDRFTMVRILLDRSRDCNINSIQHLFLFSYRRYSC